EPVVLHDAAREGPFMEDPYVRAFGPKSVLCVPIRRDRFEGVLYMENNLSSGVFTQDRVEIIRLLAAQAAVAIENARLYEEVQEYSRTLEDKVAERTARLALLNEELQGLVERDGLTGVANRRRGDAYLEEVWVRLRREKKPLSLIMLDVDHFKAYNDNYGHQSGDDCLVAVAQAIREQLQRPADMVARYGGEEFMLILPDTDINGAVQVAEKVRGAVEACAILHEHSSAANVVTLSVGAATEVPGRDSSTSHLVRQADNALYRAKGEGRNRVQTS
ncbi:MAG: sensor domain-containing diguanylate cyclase, partial [Oceanospirillales bacterium]|nr:sensor domain-containing diguanylate cyclase [Oceanospirillales bacterium]